MTDCTHPPGALEELRLASQGTPIDPPRASLEGRCGKCGDGVMVDARIEEVR